MLESTARSADGGTIRVGTVGSGPGVVVLHGGGVAEGEYRRLAAALADRCTVHLYNRRGRPGSPPLADTDTLATDLADLASVLEHTGARQVFGHSGGGFVALQAGLTLPLERIAVYDPGLSVDGRPSFAFLEALEDAVRRGQDARAMTLMARGAHPQDLGAKLPYASAELLTRAFLRTAIGRRFVELLPTVPPEVRRIAEHDGPAADYAGITAEVLLAAGSKSSAYFGENCAALAAAIPRGRAVLLPSCAHNAANVARPSFVRPFADFLGAPVTATTG
jgi:pimeloyl-ACP methyl ester carboxylesterase